MTPLARAVSAWVQKTAPRMPTRSPKLQPGRPCALQTLRNTAPLDVWILHRARHRLVGRRTTLMDQTHSLLLERGVCGPGLSKSSRAGYRS